MEKLQARGLRRALAAHVVIGARLGKSFACRAGLC
jgi:hypothetical protein